MDYQQTEQLRSLTSFFKSIHSKNDSQTEDIKAKDADISWNASRFWANVISQTSKSNIYLTLEEFKKFESKYEHKNGIKIEVEKLFSKYWLRNVLGFIQIPGSISAACRDFEKIENLKEELKFIYGFQKQQSVDAAHERKIVTKDRLTNAINDYQKNNNVTLKFEGVFFNGWLSEKEGKIELSDINHYFRPFLDYWEDFRFLTAFKTLVYEEKTLKIKAAQFETLHTAHKTIYKKTPEIREFKTQKILTEKENFFYVNFNNTEPNYWSQLSDKISGHYWEMLINEDRFKNDEQRIKEWISKIFYWNAWPDPILFVTESAKRKLLLAAFSLVINDADTESVDEEFKKIYLDNNHHHAIQTITDETFFTYRDFSINNDSLFEVLESMNSWEETAHTTYLYEQDSREHLTFLISLIVKHDTEFYLMESDNEPRDKQPDNYHYIICLLRTGITKPFLVWEITRFIIRYRQEVIPYLIIEHDLSALAFILIDSIDFPEEQKFYWSLECWKKSTSLMLRSLPLSEENNEKAALIIFQVYRQLNSKKYSIPYNRSKKTEFQLRHELNKKEQAVLLLIEEASLHRYFKNNGDSKYLLPNLFVELSKLFKGLISKPKYWNSSVQFPMLQWDGIIWLLRISTYWKYKKQFLNLNVDVNDLTNSFLNLYLQTIEITEIKAFNFFDQKEEVDIPMWSEKVERLAYLDWLYPIYLIYINGKLGNFLSPNFNFKNTDDIYDKHNDFTGNKLRTHIGVLLEVLQKLVLPSIPYGFSKEDIILIKKRIEQQIIDYLKSHVENIPGVGRIDLFNFSKESRFQTSYKEALLPQIARAINFFDDKEAVIDSIIQSGDVAKILTLLEYITSAGIQKILLDKLQNIDIRTFLEEYHWIPEIQNVLEKISHYPQLIEQTEKAIHYWEEKVINNRKDREYKDLLYRTRLLQAYFKNDERELNQIAAPVREYQQSLSDLTDLDYKNFYRGLIWMKTDPEKAYNIFNDLVNQKSQYSSFALNRLISKINWADRSGSIDLYREGYEEWKEYAKTLDKDIIPSLEPDLSGIMLTILNKLNEYEKADEVFQKLEFPFKMLANILEERINSLIIQKRIDEALMLIDSAKTYHRFSSVADIQFIDDLEKKVNGIDNIEELKGHYLRIFSSAPAKLVKIFPENLNGKIELNEFIIKEIIHSVDKMLDKIMSIKEIKGEDKYNDIVEMGLDARINTWGWHIGAQSRGAFSAPATGGIGKQPGERDLPVIGQNKKILMICEAFIYRGQSTAKTHLVKLFNYYHQRNAFAILVYDTGKRGKDFEKNWKDYTNKILPKIKFPVGYRLTGDVNDATNAFDFKNSAIKVSTSIHEVGTIIYHIFVNINYKVS